MAYSYDRTARLVQKYREDNDRKEWALLESDGPKVLKWFGTKKPSEEEVLKEERRIQFFKHKGASAQMGRYSYDRSANLLFVYGSLRRGEEEHHKMVDAPFVAAMETAPAYSLLAIRDFRALAAGADVIEGELYQVDEAKLAELDDWEYSIFTRTAIRLADGSVADAYVLAPSPEHFRQVSAKDKLPGGLADKGPPKGVDPKQIEKGLKVEREHTDDPDIAREIVYDHLTEDPRYYDKLEKIEKEAYCYDRR